MLKTIAPAIAGLTLFAFTAAAQDAPPAPPAPPKPPATDEADVDVDVHRAGVVVIEEDDGEGPRVIVLEGIDLEDGVLVPGLDMDLDLDHTLTLDGKSAHGRIRLSDGGETYEWTFEDGDVKKHLEHVRERIKAALRGGKGAEALPGFDAAKLFDPTKRGEMLKTLRERAKQARAKRERQAAIDALKLDDEAATVVVPLLDEVLQTRAQARAADASRRAELANGPQDEAALRPKLESLRAAAKRDAAALAAARAELRGLLTLEQEIELVLRGVLD